jgi:hypothetical protein
VTPTWYRRVLLDRNAVLDVRWFTATRQLKVMLLGELILDGLSLTPAVDSRHSRERW